MPHGFTSTGITFADGTVQAQASNIVPVGTMMSVPSGVTNPAGWINTNAYYSKATYPALNTVLGDETAQDQFEVPSYATYTFYNESSASWGDRRSDRMVGRSNGTIIAVGVSGRVFRSTNFGQTFTNLGAVGGSTNANYTICGNGAGSYLIGGNNMLKYSTNDGISWTTINTPAGLNQNFHGSAYDSVNNQWVLISSAGFVIRSSNLTTWTNIGVNWADRVYKLAFGVIGGVGYLVWASDGGWVGWSTNGGASWSIDQFRTIGQQTVNKIRFFNNRFFLVSDNGDIAYTNYGLAPNNVNNWTRQDNFSPTRGTFNAELELTDVAFCDINKCWIIGTNGGQWFWGPDVNTTTGSTIPVWYMRTGMHLRGQQGVSDSWAQNGHFVQNSYGQSGVDGYNNPLYDNGYAYYNLNNVPNKPSQVFWCPSFRNDVAYFEKTTKHIIKAFTPTS
jgi:hypothetical protein